MPFTIGHIINLGRKLSEEHKSKIRSSHIGSKHTDETKIKLSKVHKGLPSSFKGHKHSLETKRRMSQARMKYRNELHPRWKGGITPINYRERRRFRREVQRLVFERDNYTCQLCFKRGIDLQVDHIKPWSKFVLLRFSLENCRTLCSKCHYEVTFNKPMPNNITGWGHNKRRDLP